MKKTYIALLFSFAMVSVGLAIPISPFPGWDNLIAQSPEIIFARCTATMDFLSSTNGPRIIVDGMVPSEIEVLSVLKGNSTPGLATMSSEYWPYRGEYFLLFANNHKDELNKGYTAVEAYRVVPLNHFFWTRQLAGKTLEEQVHLILQTRLKELNLKMKEESEEKARIESAFKKPGESTAPPASTPPPASGSTKPF